MLNLYIQAQMARQAEQDPTNLYIANLPHNIKENDLESMFSQYGRVSVHILLELFLKSFVLTVKVMFFYEIRLLATFFHEEETL